MRAGFRWAGAIGAAVVAAAGGGGPAAALGPSARVVYRIADPRIEQLCATVCESAVSRMPAPAGSARLVGAREGL